MLLKPRYLFRYSFAFYLLALLYSCNLINPAEPIPTYIRIHEPKLITQSAQGSSSESISNYWVFQDNQAIGVFNRTGNYPILATSDGPSKIFFLAGIKDNGTGNLRVVYPFYTTDSIVSVLSPNGSIDFYPTFRYISGTQFKVVEDFELGSTLVNADTSNMVVRTSNAAEVFEGAYSARIKIDSLHPAIELLSIDPFTLPTGGIDIYIELNYKSDVPFRVGLQAMNNSQKYYQWTINAKDSWNKIYLNAKSLVNNVNATSWKLLFLSNPEDLSTPRYIYLDNIKVLHL